MSLRRALQMAACFFALADGSALAQFPAAPGAPQQQPPCVADFTKLRLDTENKAKAIQTASKRHATPKEACHLFTAFQAAQNKMLKYASDNATWCGIPPQVVDQIKAGIAQAAPIRAKLCKMAEAPPPRPAGPSLSDALTSPVPDANNIKTGRGTFDTLTGSPIGK
jgi:hypothetical protein